MKISKMNKENKKEEGSHKHRRRKRKTGPACLAHNRKPPLYAFPPTNMTTFLTFSSNFIFLFSHFSSHPSSISIISWQQQHNPLAPNTHLFFLRLLTALPFLEVYLRLSVSSCSRFRILSHCDLVFVLFDPLLRLCFISFSGSSKFLFFYLFEFSSSVF